MLPSPAIPHCRDDPPWGECGDPRSPWFGSVFAWPAAGDGLKLTFDPLGRRHALTLFDGFALGPELVIQGRRFSVVPPSGPERIA